MSNMGYYEKSLLLHAMHKGKLEITSKTPVKTGEDLLTAYLPGVTEPCLLIAQDPANARLYSIKANTVAVVSDGSAVPGLGDIGGLASLPALEGAAVLLKEFGGLDAFPICLDTQDVEEIVGTVKHIATGFGGIDLEDISAPRCFEIEKRLKEELDIPVFHDNQHGTAVVVSAAVINAFRLLEKPLPEVRAVICGAGAAGNAIAKMLAQLGVRDIIVCDSKGILGASRLSEFGEDKLELIEFTNKDGITGGIEKAVYGRDLFIGVSKPEVLTKELVKTMGSDPVIFALAYPEPEILPELARQGGARVVGTGCAEFPNHIDNLLVSPGMFRGALDAGAKEITVEMMAAAAYALAGLVADEELSEEYILPAAFSEGVTEAVAKAVSKTWLDLKDK